MSVEYRNLSESTPLITNEERYYSRYSGLQTSNHFRPGGIRGSLVITPRWAQAPNVEIYPQRRGVCSRFSFKELIFISAVLVIGIGCKISYDTPGALQSDITKNYELSVNQFSLLYSLYFIPTIVLNCFGGFLIDRFMGIKLSMFVYSFIGIIGLALFTAGGITNIFWLMLVGRLIFGLGNELVTAVGVNYCIFSRYRNTIMNLASSVFHNGSAAGTVIVYQSGPRLFSYLKEYVNKKESLDIAIILASGMFIIAAAFAVLMTYSKPNDSTFQIDSAYDTAPHRVTNNEKTASLKDILAFPLVFWFLCLLNCFYCVLNYFSQFSQELLTSDEFHLTADEASNIVTVMSSIKFCLSIPVGLSVDFIGRNTRYIIVAQAICTLAFFFFVLGMNPYGGMILVGLSTSVFNAAVLPMFAYPVEKHLIGSCYGITSAVGGFGMFIAPLLVKALINKYGYHSAINFYFFISIISMLMVLAIWYLDKQSTGILNMTPSQRIDYENKRKKDRI